MLHRTACSRVPPLHLVGEACTRVQRTCCCPLSLSPRSAVVACSGDSRLTSCTGNRRLSRAALHGPVGAVLVGLPRGAARVGWRSSELCNSPALWQQVQQVRSADALQCPGRVPFSTGLLPAATNAAESRDGCAINAIKVPHGPLPCCCCTSTRAVKDHAPCLPRSTCCADTSPSLPCWRTMPRCATGRLICAPLHLPSWQHGQPQCTTCCPS